MQEVECIYQRNTRKKLKEEKKKEKRPSSVGMDEKDLGKQNSQG